MKLYTKVTPASILRLGLAVGLLASAGAVSAGESGASPASENSSTPASTQPFKRRQAAINVLQPAKTKGTVRKLTGTAIESPPPENGQVFLSTSTEVQEIWTRQVLNEKLRTTSTLPPEKLATENKRNLQRSFEAARLTNIRSNGAFPEGWTVECSFIPGDLYAHRATASLGCALILESLRTSYVPGESVAVAGLIREDGTIAHVPGLPKMITAAGTTSLKWLCIPRESLMALYAEALTTGPAFLVSIPVFDVATLAETIPLTGPALPEPQQRAIQLFEDIRKALPAQKSPALWLKHPKVIAKLNEVLEAAPGHTAARVLLMLAGASEKPAPSPATSIEIIQNMVTEVRGIKFELLVGRGSKSAVLAATKRFDSLKPLLHERTLAFAEAARAFSEQTVDTKKEGTSDVRNQLRAAMHKSLAPPSRRQGSPRCHGRTYPRQVRHFYEIALSGFTPVVCMAQPAAGPGHG